VAHPDPPEKTRIMRDASHPILGYGRVFIPPPDASTGTGNLNGTAAPVLGTDG
jgi:hypothetical protein